ncbi:uncharacterized protein ACOB8E_004470 [Sarcophilus harrisii]
MQTLGGAWDFTDAGSSPVGAPPSVPSSGPSGFHRAWGHCRVLPVWSFPPGPGRRGYCPGRAARREFCTGGTEAREEAGIRTAGPGLRARPRGAAGDQGTGRGQARGAGDYGAAATACPQPGRERAPRTPSASNTMETDRAEATGERENHICRSPYLCRAG